MSAAATSTEALWAALDAGDWSRATLAALHDLLEDGGGAGSAGLREALIFLIKNHVGPPTRCTGRYYWDILLNNFQGVYNVIGKSQAYAYADGMMGILKQTFSHTRTGIDRPSEHCLHRLAWALVNREPE